ncbi:MAG: TatD family hydrolase, partial [Muribaculaceae bacterium]|nr:TatD family hydrolase [Muribaculaceae bacterium]
MQILDIHTHHPAPQPEAVIAVSPAEFKPVPNQFYSVGIHPWDTIEEVSTETWNLFEQAATHPQVVAIGECGIDLVKGGPLYR